MLALACALHAYLLIPQYHVVDLAPVGNLPKAAFPHTLTFTGASAGGRRIDFSVRFPANKTAAEVRDITLGVIQSTTLGVKKLGDTKVMIFGCQRLNLKAQITPKKEFPESCRPTMSVFINGRLTPPPRWGDE